MRDPAWPVAPMMAIFMAILLKSGLCCKSRWAGYC
jgi:hypothetical protein